MKPFVEKLPVAENDSFVAATHATPHFEVPWHQHVEYELILFTAGEGSSFIGNYVGGFATGDLFFLGSNLPHTFQKAQPDLFTSAVVVHFKEDSWGENFFKSPECREIRLLFNAANKGLQVNGQSLEILQKKVRLLETTSGFARTLILFECLHLLASKQDYTAVSTQEISDQNPRQKERIDAIFNYTLHNFRDPISLEQVAEHARLSIPAFCSYFKKSTKKTYIDFLNEVRISHACQQLMDTQMTVSEVCYESGFNTPANFNKQFFKIKKTTPSQYRKLFLKR